MAATIAAAAAFTASGAPLGGTLEDIIERGKLVAGTKTDYAPWGMRDTDGNIVGMEIDMINDFAKRIGEKYGKRSRLKSSQRWRPTACSSSSRARST